MSDNDAPESNKESFGGCTYSVRSPVALAADTKVVNLQLSFEEALKLNVALAACVQHLTRLDRGTPEKRRSGVKLIVHLDEKHRVRVQLGKVPPKEKP
jgi:hypothetical protein